MEKEIRFTLIAQRIIKVSLKVNKDFKLKRILTLDKILKASLMLPYYYLNTERSQMALDIWKKQLELVKKIHKKTKSLDIIINSDWQELAKEFNIYY